MDAKFGGNIMLINSTFGKCLYHPEVLLCEHGMPPCRCVIGDILVDEQGTFYFGDFSTYTTVPDNSRPLYLNAACEQLKLGRLVRLTSKQQHTEWYASAVTQQVDFPGEPTFGAA